MSVFADGSAKKRHVKAKQKEEAEQIPGTQIVDLDTTRDLPVKRPLSAYVHFLNQGREKMQISHPEIGVIEQTTILGKQWRQMSKQARQKFVQLAKAD